MPLRRWFCALVLGLSCGVAGVAAAQTGDAPRSPCSPAAAASDALPPTRLPGLDYDCIVLAGGQALQVGRAGAAGAPPLLLVHGLGQNAHRDWMAVLGVLAQRWRVIAVDLPGFGASPPPIGAYAFDRLAGQLAELLQRLAPGRRAMVVGHSLGAAVTLQLAHRHAEQVERLVLVDAAGILLKPVYLVHFTRLGVPQVGIDPLDRLLRAIDGRVGALGDWLLGLDDRLDLGPWLMRFPEARQALFGGLLQADAAFGLVEHDFSAAIRETPAPTTVIWGRDDRIAPLRTGQLLAARLPRAQLKVIDGVGHTPMMENPSEFMRHLAAALEGPPPQREPPFDAGPSQGHVLCRDGDGASYSGRFESLTLERCTRVRITRARIGRLVLEGSSASLVESTVDADDVALTARDSQLQATAARLRGRVAVRADNSVLDLAGTSLQAREEAIESPSSTARVFLSVCDWQDRNRQADAHFVWPRGAR